MMVYAGTILIMTLQHHRKSVYSWIEDMRKCKSPALNILLIPIDAGFDH